MAEEEKDLSPEKAEAAAPKEVTPPPAGKESPPGEELEGKPLSGREILNISYVVLFIGGVFAVNAMDGFSPYAISIVLGIVGFALFAYGQYKRWLEKQAAPQAPSGGAASSSAL